VAKGELASVGVSARTAPAPIAAQAANSAAHDRSMRRPRVPAISVWDAVDLVEIMGHEVA
jgi:hypothetical protein